MKSRHLSHHELLEYTVYDDLIVYPPLNSTNRIKPTQNIGILIAKIQNWSTSLEKLNELCRYSLIDSFSVQIEIKNEIQSFLILKITGIGSNELKFRYNNLKKRTQEEINYLTLLTQEELEETYLSLLGEGDRKIQKSSTITRQQHLFFITTQATMKSYYFLADLNIQWLCQDKKNIKFIIELLHVANIQCDIVFYSKNYGNSSQNTSYLYTITKAYHNFHCMLSEQLTQVGYPFEIKNKFHPFYLGRILTRGPIESKNMYITKSPPIFYTDLDFFSQIPPLLPEISDIERLLHDIPKERKIEGFYSLFGGQVIFFIVKKLNLVTIRVISSNLTTSFHYCLIYFESKHDYQFFSKKIEKMNSVQKTIILCELGELKKVLKEMKGKYGVQKNSDLKISQV